MRQALLRTGRLLLRAGRRFLADEGQTRAAALTYTTLLSLVPFLAVFFALFSAFDTFLRTESRLEAFLLDHLLPGSAASAIQYLTRFRQKTAALGAAGFAALLVTSLLLLNSIEGTFRHIHRLPEGRSLRQRLLSYWTMLTVTPVLIGLSFYLTGTVRAYAHVLEAAGVAEVVQALTVAGAVVFPFLVSFGAFTVAYVVLPATQVRLPAAMAGAAVAALLWEAGKWGFDWYVRSFASFERVYGAVALLPVFLVWIYLTWIVVLLGGEVAYCAQHPEPGPAEAGPSGPRPAPGSLAARLLWVVARDFATGRQRPTVERAAEDLGVDQEDAERSVAALEAAGLVARVFEPGDDRSPGLLPARSLEAVTVADAVRAGEAEGGGRAGGTAPADPTGEVLAAAESAAMGRLERETYAGLIAAWREREARAAGDAAREAPLPFAAPEGLGRTREASGGTRR